MIAGDVFDTWKVSPETVNRAIQEFSEFDCGVFAIPGQHDLLHHNYRDIKLTSYWTLVEAKAITDLAPGVHILKQEDKRWTLEVHSFPWGTELKRCKEKRLTKRHSRIALVHAYIWVETAGYHGAPVARDALRYAAENLRGYDVGVFGDNHKGFGYKDAKRGFVVLNCGGFAPRKSDEREYKPWFGVITDGLQVHTFHNIMKVKWDDDLIQDLADHNDDKGKPVDLESLVEILDNLGEQSLDFKTAIDRYLLEEKVPSSVRQIILTAMEK